MKTNGLTNFKPIPLYMINASLDRKELERQLKLMKDSGITAFFIHARDGLTERGFGNKKWYEDITYIFDKSEEYGLTAYLYDEDPYPSGNLGGKIALDHKEFIARELFVKKVDVNCGIANELLGDARPLQAYAVKKDGTVRILTDCFGVIRKDFYSTIGNFSYNGYTDVCPHRRSATFHPQSNFYADDIKDDEEVYVAYASLCSRINRYGCLADNLNKDCVDYYKEYAYKKQVEAIPKKIKGKRKSLIFTDEPVAGGMLPWTEKIEEYFLSKKGYSLTENYYRLILEDDFSQTVRKDYYEIASEMFKENFIENLRDYSKENGLEFMGHLENEENLYLQAIKCVNVYDCMWEFNHPGFDVIYVKTSTREDYRQVFGAKLVTSVAHQRGSERIFCEMFGITPYNFGLEGMKRYCGWTYIMGANTSVPHGFFYSNSGYRKYDAGKSFFFQAPDFGEFPKFSEFAETYGKMLSEYQPTAKTLLVAPNWEFAISSEEECEKLNAKLLSLVKLLTENHIEFDITDCSYIDKNFKGSKAKVGIKEYNSIVYLKSDKYIMQSIFEKIEKVDAERFVFIKEEIFDIKRLKENSVYTEMISVKGDEKDILTFRKSNESENCLFVFNNTAENTIVKIRVDGYASIYDIEKREYLSVEEKKGFIEVSLEGYTFYAIKISQIKEELDKYRIQNYDKKDISYEEQGQWTYIPPIDVKAIVNKYDLKVESNGKKEKIMQVNSGWLRELYSADNERILIDALQDSSKVIKNYPVKAEFVARFDCLQATKMLFEKETFTHDAKIYLNGKEIRKEEFKSVNIYDINNIEVDVSNRIKKHNELRVIFDTAMETSGIIGEIYFY